jgi:hypothetical protein
VRTFEVVVGAGAAGAVTATVTNVNVTTGPLVTVTVTAAPIDFDGDGKPDCYRFFPPRQPPEEASNVIPSNATQTPEVRPWTIRPAGQPDDTDLICLTAKTYTGVVNLNSWLTPTGTIQTDLAYVSVVTDPILQQPGGCPAGETCRIWTGVKPAGSVTFAPGNKVSVKVTVTLKTIDLATKVTTSKRLKDVQVRDFDLMNPDFQAAALGAVKSTVGSSDPTIKFSLLSTILGIIFNADKGEVGRCTTVDDTGLCFAGQAAPAYDGIIGKWADPDTLKTVFIADIRQPKDFVNGVAVENLVITKIFKNGVFQGYAPSILQEVDND